MKKILSIVLLIFTLFSVTTCSAKPSAEEKYWSDRERGLAPEDLESLRAQYISLKDLLFEFAVDEKDFRWNKTHVVITDTLVVWKNAIHYTCFYAYLSTGVGETDYDSTFVLCVNYGDMFDAKDWAKVSDNDHLRIVVEGTVYMNSAWNDVWELDRYGGLDLYEYGHEYEVVADRIDVIKPK